MSEPKTCPFCGAAPDIRPWHGGVPTKTMVSCYNMDCAVQPEVTGKTEEEAVAAWNRRAPDPKCQAIVEMLRRRIDVEDDCAVALFNARLARPCDVRRQRQFALEDAWAEARKIVEADHE